MIARGVGLLLASASVASCDALLGLDGPPAITDAQAPPPPVLDGAPDAFETGTPPLPPPVGSGAPDASEAGLVGCYFDDPDALGALDTCVLQ